jgi:hypothetical protein
MTTVVSRLFADAATADAAVAALRAQGHPPGNIDIIAKGPQAAERIAAARVSQDAAAKYAAKLDGGRALVVVRAPFTPLGAALNAIETIDRFESVNAGVADQNAYIRESPSSRFFGLSILKGSPLLLTTKLPPGRLLLSSKDAARRDAGIGTISSKLGLRLLSRERLRRSAIHGGAYMSRKFLPFPLLKRHSDRLSVIRGGTVFSNALALPLLTRRS